MKTALFILFGLFLVASTGGRFHVGNAQSAITVKVLSSEGQVEVHRDSRGRVRIENVAFKVNDDLFAGDTIITGKSGRMVLGLSDGSQAVIAPKTTLVIQDLQQSPRTLFQMIKGKTRVHIEKLGGQPNPYRVNTPTAVIAVRGTIFDVEVADGQTDVFLHEGAVDVFNFSSPAQTVFLNAGQTTRILGSRPPSAPATFKVGRNDSLFQMREMRQQGLERRNQSAANQNGNQNGNQGGNQRQNGERQPSGNDRNKPNGIESGSRQGPQPGGTPPSAPRPNSAPNAGGGGPRRP